METKAFDNSGTEITLREYEDQYSKNFRSIKLNYKQTIPSRLALEKIVHCVIHLNKSFSFIKCKSKFHLSPFLLGEDKTTSLRHQKIYCFLSSLAFFEIDSNKTHDQFVYNLILIEIKK